MPTDRYALASGDDETVSWTALGGNCAVIRPEDLYTVVHEPRADEKPVLLHALAGFLDAGSVGDLVTEEILDAFEHEVVVRFDVDRLIDYRARRPRMHFERDHWASYNEPSIVIHRVIDSDGQVFLMLTGPEPDRYWNAFVAALLQIVDLFGVRLAVGFQGIPMAVPHTRPVGLTSHATDADLLPSINPSWIEAVDVPGSVNSLFEYRAGQAGHAAIGFAVHVPHYLATGRFAEGSLHLLQAMSDATGLRFPLVQMGELAESEREAIASELAGSAEVTGVVRALEQQYDQFTAAAASTSLPAVRDVEMPTADELGEQVEAFLRSQRHDTDPDAATD